MRIGGFTVAAAAAGLLGLGAPNWASADPVPPPPPKSKKEKKTEKGDKTMSDAKTVTTASGLQYIDLKVGAGDGPRAGKRVSVHYTGWLKNGKKFDSSVDRGEPFSFVIGARQVIAGWDEGVMSMKVGGRRKLIIPAALGYGERGFSSVIPPNSELTFEVELLGVD